MNASHAIWRFSWRRYRLPFQTAVRTAHGWWREREGVLVRLEDASGAARFGEAAPIPWFGTETADQAEEACRALGRAVNAEAISGLAPELPCLRHALGAASAQPSDFLLPTSYLPVAALLPAGRVAVAAAVAKAEAGFRIFKWKVGVEQAATEWGILDELCAALPEGSKLRLDANGAWERPLAEKWMQRCAERPVEHVEQPVRCADQPAREADVLLGLARDYPTPIALDESLVSRGDLERWIGAGWPGIYVVKSSLFADPVAALADLERAHAKVVFSSALETAIGAADALRAAFAWRGEARALGFGVWPLFADARLDGPAAAPFIRAGDLDHIDPEAAWNALS